MSSNNEQPQVSRILIVEDHPLFQEALRELIAGSWGRRTDRGAEARLATGTTERRPLIQIGELKRDPHLEMHTRGG